MTSIAQEVSGNLFNDYNSLAVITAVGYDYILTFSDEVEYIWNKPWTRVSTLFLLARYFGLFFAIISAIFGSTFLPGPEKTGEIVTILSYWAFSIFYAAADMVIILRVWALYGRSQFILATLLMLYAAEIFSILISSIVASTGNSFSIVLDLSTCTKYAGAALTILAYISDVLQMVLASSMCLLAFIQFIKAGLQMYKVTKHFRPNHCMTLLVSEGLVYFFAIVARTLISIVSYVEPLPQYGCQGVLFAMIQGIPPFVLIPRFIVNLRKLHARDVWGRGRSEIDTAFGLTSLSDPVTSAIMFADRPGQNEGAEDGEAQDDGIDSEEKGIRRDGSACRLAQPIRSGAREGDVGSSTYQWVMER